jgi:hypothetical protein
MIKVILLSHILIAVTSVAYTAYALIMPTRQKIRMSGNLVAATIASGTVLVVGAHANMVQSCITGLLYTGVMLSGIAVARMRLADAPERND